MARTYLSGQKMTRPGTYFKRSAIGIVTEGAINGICACIIGRCNWGPLNTVFDVDQTDMNNLDDYYGTGEGVDAIKEALLGGAQVVRVVRVGDATGACASLKLKNTAETPVDAVNLIAKYEGDRSFSVLLKTNLISEKRELQILEGTELFLSVTFEAGEDGDEAQALVDALANNRFFTAKKLAAGVLADIDVQTPMTGGRNPAPTEGSYGNATDLLERYKWNCVISDSDDSSVTAMLIDFVKQSYETGHLGFTCIGGLSTQGLTDRMRSAAAINDEKIVYVLNGWRDIYGVTYEGWRAAARIGGMIAGCECNTSLTHLVMSNALELIEPLTNGEITRAEEKGCFVMSLNDEDQVQIDNAITTLVTLGNNMDEGWKKIRRTKTRFELMTRVNSTCDKLVGRLNNDEHGRATLITAMNSIINEMVAEHKLFAGSYVEEDPAHKPEGDSAYFILHIGDIDSLEKIYLDYTFSFANPFAA